MDTGIALSCRFAAFSLFLGAATAQSCDGATGGGGGTTGSGCVEINYCVTSPDRESALLEKSARPLPTGETMSSAYVIVPPAAVTTSTDIAGALRRVGDGGPVLITGGEFRQTVALVRTWGFDAVHPFQIGLNYRSFEVDSWREGGDSVGTLDDPFGPGWRASWGDLLEQPPENIEVGTPVYRVDEHGVRWRHTALSVSSGFTSTTWIFDAQAGVRLVREDHLIGGQTYQIWFKESPDRTRTEYFPPSGGSGDLVAKRIYRGAYAAPDWQVVFSYTGNSLRQMTDARGITHDFVWGSVGTASRVMSITTRTPASWGSGSSGLTTNFEYETTPPYLLSRVRRPSRQFLDDQDRSGTYDSGELFDEEIVTHYVYPLGSSRLQYVYDESTGLARQMLEVTYDSAPLFPWRVVVLKDGEVSSLPGQGQRVQTMSYPQTGRTVWVDARGVVRKYDYTTVVGGATLASPRQWRVTHLEELSGPNDPRPVTDPDYHATLAWDYTWNCGCGQLTGVKMPSGLEHRIGYDTQGRGLVTSTGIIPAGSSTLEQVRLWTYEDWNHADYRLASRLKTYTNALGKVGTNAFTFDGAYGGYRTDGTFEGVDLFHVQEDAGGRVVWTEEGTFNVDGGGTSNARIGYQVGTNAGAADFMLTKQIDTYQGSSVYSSRTFTYGGLGWMLSVTDELGRTSTLTYDSIGWLRQANLPTTSSGRGSATYAGTFTFEYDRFGQVAVSTQNAVDDQGGAYGRATITKSRVFDYFSRPWKELTDVAPLTASTPQNLVTTYEYDAGDRLVSVQASGGREVRYLVDDHGRLYQEKRRLDGSTWSVEQHGFHLDGVLARVVEPTGLVGTIDTLDAWGRPQRIHLPGEKHVFLTRDDEDRVTQSEYRTGSGASVLQQTIASVRDDLGRAVSETVSAPGLATTRGITYAYNGSARVATAVDGDGRGAAYGYDALGRLIRKQDRLLGTSGNAEVFTRDVMGNVSRIDHVEQRQTGASTFVPVTYRIDLAYDNWDRLVRAEFWGSASSLQFTRNHGYDSLGNATWYKDGVGKETRRAYDAAGRIVDEWMHQRNAAATPVHLTRSYNDGPSDPLLSAILTRTDGIGNTSEYRYDLLGRLVDRRLPGHSPGSSDKHWTYTYDLAGRLEGWIDGNGTQVQQVYDAERRLQERRVIGLPTNGVTLSLLATNEAWTYDEFDRVASADTQWAIYPFLAGVPAPSLVQAIDQYDGIGRQTVERFQYLGGAATKDLAYGYAKAGGGEDAAFRRSMLTSSGFQIGTVPDGAGKLASMTLSGPGIANQPLADWRYEGSRPIRRGFLPGAATTTEIVTESAYNQLRHMTQSTTTRFVSGTGNTVWDLQMERDAEGNVLQHRYAKASGAVGDWFQLDGWDRLQEAKLGVQSFTGTYLGATSYDAKITYALDHAHNRESVDVESHGATATTSYDRRNGTNEYKGVTTDGDAQKWLYDGNGNLLSDGYYIYVYDHLDRLSEVYLLTYPGGAEKVQANGETTVEVFDKVPQGKRDGKETILPVQAWRGQVLAARQRVLQRRATAETPAWDPRPPFSVNEGTTGASAAAVNEPVPVLVAYYGYDPSNRRIGKLLAEGGGAFYAWSGWDLIEAYDVAFQPSTVYFEGGVIDEHLGFAHRNVSGGWDRYGYVQDHTRGVVKVVNSAGSVVEQYEYDPYGKMSVFTAAGAPNGAVPTVAGQIYGFTGRQLDPETGLIYYRRRYYQSAHGRFLSEDPVGGYDAASWGSQYAYVGASPGSWIDPMGLFTVVVVVTNHFQKDGEKTGDVNKAMDTVDSDPEGGIVIHVDVDKDGVPTQVDKDGKPSKLPRYSREPKKGKRRTVTHLYISAHGSEKFRSNAPFNGSHMPGGATAANKVVEILTEVFNSADIPGEDKDPAGGGAKRRGPNGGIVVWVCHGGSREWEEASKRKTAFAPALADYFRKEVKAYDCAVSSDINGKNASGKAPQGRFIQPVAERPQTPSSDNPREKK